MHTHPALYLRLIAFILLCIAGADLHAQELNWKVHHVSIEDGLSNRFVNSIIQDNRGFMWIGTNFGLNRYDGHRMDVLTQQNSDLSGNTIFDLQLDVRHNIWIIHRSQSNFPISGIDIIDPLTFAITTIENYIDDPLPFKVEDIIQVSSGEHHEIYLIHNTHSIFRYDSTGLKKIQPGNEEMNNIYSGLSRGGLVYNSNFYSETTISALVKSFMNEFSGQLQLNDPSSSKNKSYAYLGESGKGYPVIQAIHSETEILEIISFPNGQKSDQKVLFELPAKKYSKNITTFWDPYSKKVWLTAHPHGFIIDPVSGKSGTLEFLPKEQIKAIFFLPNGKIWLGTEDGIYMITPQIKFFETYLSRVDTQFSCRGFAESFDGNIFVLTHDGNKIINTATNETRNWDLQMAGIACLTDRRGNIWIVEENKFLHKYNPVTRQDKKWNRVGDRSYSHWSILEVRSGQILVGATNGIWIKNPDDNEPQMYFTKLNGFDKLKESTVFHMLETNDGIWLATSKGLFLMDLQKGILAHYDKSTGLPYDNLLFLHIDKQGVYWIGTRGQGLIRWDRKHNSYKSYTTSEGLSHNVIYAVFEDNNGFLWMTSDYGLMRFEKQTGTCRTFLPADGIPHEEFNRASYFKDSKGNFYFGGLRGFLKFHPDNIINAADTSYPLLLTRFEVLNGKSGEIEDWTTLINSSQEIVLEPNVKSFVIHYSLLDFEDPKLKRYAYKIEGLDNRWNYVSENFIRINGLSGGQYAVNIKGQSAAGLWSEKELVLPIRVMVPFLIRPWTLISAFLFIGGLTIFFIRKRIAWHKAKLLREQEISNQLRNVDKLKDQFLANTSHELRTPLNGIVGLSESLLDKVSTSAEKEDLEMIISSGRRLSNLVNDILDFSRLKEHDLALQLKPVDLRALANNCLRMNRHAVGDKPVSLINQIDDQLPNCYADENRLQQILQNLVANAIKFTPSGSVTISAKQNADMIEISVSDTGIGIEESKQAAIFREFEQADGSISREFGGTGLGLSISKYLVELHGGKINVTSTPSKGSTFSFSIPVYNGVGNETPKQDSDWQPERYEPVSKQNGAQDITVINGSINSHKEILIVDDEPVNLKVLKNHLEQEGYRVTMAKDGHEALTHLQNGKKFHLVLLDVMMPRIPGYEVCQKIREKYLLSELPVIMVTAKNQLSDLVEGLSVGANDYINKPFSKQELLSRVKTQLQTFDIYEATGRFVPHQFIQSLGRQGITDLQRGDMVERNVHVMFSDIRDYTSLAEEMTPLDNFKFVNSLASKVGPLVKNNDGIINQYLGDTIMMLFLQKADDGVQAAIEIHRMLHQYNADRKNKNRKSVKLGIGIHSGPLIMGIIGDTDRTEAAVISDTVNTASRMEGLTKHFSANLILSEATLNKIEDRDKFNIRYLGKVQVKGKYQPIRIYECFDGDNPEQVILKKKTFSNFNEGIAAYYEKDMLKALHHFEAVYQSNPADITAFGFLHKVHGNIVNGLSEDWNGVETMHFK